MSEQLRLVEAFIGSWAGGMDTFHDAVRRTFTADTVWENVGYSSTVGADSAIDHLRDGAARLKYDKVLVDMLHIAEAGGCVMTERVDHHYDRDGSLLFSIRAASVFELEDGHITALREYFDTAPLVALLDSGKRGKGSS